MTSLLVSPFGMKVRQNRLSNDFGKTVDQFIRQEAVPAIKQATQSLAVPAVNIKKSKDSYELMFSLPGFKKENVKISVENNILVVEGRKDDTAEDGTKILYKEFRHENFKRSFSLSEEIDSDNIEASFNAGILTVKLGIKKIDEKQNKFNISIH